MCPFHRVPSARLLAATEALSALGKSVTFAVARPTSRRGEHRPKSRIHRSARSGRNLCSRSQQCGRLKGFRVSVGDVSRLKLFSSFDLTTADGRRVEESVSHSRSP